LHNIKRFIGKSSDNPMRRQRRELEKQLKILENEKDAETNEKKREIENRIAETDANYYKHSSLAEKAIFLQFKMREHEGVEFVE
jgi:hypothetical protein